MDPINRINILPITQTDEISQPQQTQNDLPGGVSNLPDSMESFHGGSLFDSLTYMPQVTITPFETTATEIQTLTSRLQQLEQAKQGIQSNLLDTEQRLLGLERAQAQWPTPKGDYDILICKSELNQIKLELAEVDLSIEQVFVEIEKLRSKEAEDQSQSQTNGTQQDVTNNLDKAADSYSEMVDARDLFG